MPALCSHSVPSIFSRRLIANCSTTGFSSEFGCPPPTHTRRCTLAAHSTCTPRCVPSTGTPTHNHVHNTHSQLHTQTHMQKQHARNLTTHAPRCVPSTASSRACCRTTTRGSASSCATRCGAGGANKHRNRPGWLRSCARCVCMPAHVPRGAARLRSNELNVISRLPDSAMYQPCTTVCVCLWHILPMCLYPQHTTRTYTQHAQTHHTRTLTG